MWYKEAVFYQIYPFGFSGNEGIKRLEGWIPHIKKLGANAVYFCPVFESDYHGYDTADYNKIDSRLGTEEDFKKLCKKLHDEDIKIVLDGVLNHVGRGFWAFKDLIENKENSKYKDWFHVDFSKSSNYNDGFWYKGWEGHYDLVSLRLDNEEVRLHLFSAIKGWVEKYDIDGLRLDVAYLLPEFFIRELAEFCKNLKKDFFLVGEAIHGDYNQIIGPGKLHSCTNYECYKGLHSSFNDNNMFEIAHSLNRQFGSEAWALYKGQNLFSFAENHDVSRIATILKDEKQIIPLYGLLFAMPGIPCVYYGGEWGAKGDKKDGDESLRPFFEKPVENELFNSISKFAKMHRENKAFCYGSYKQIYLTNKQFIFSREHEGKAVIAAINAGSESHEAIVHLNCKSLVNLENGKPVNYTEGIEMKAYSCMYYEVEHN